MFCPGRQKWHGMFCPGDKNCMGCFVRGGKLMRDVLSGVAKNGMESIEEYLHFTLVTRNFVIFKF